MKLEYQLSEEDILNFNDFHHKHSKVAKRSFWKSTALCTISCFIVMMFLFSKKEYQPIYILFAVATSLFAGFLYTFYHKSYIKRYAKKALKEGENKGLLTPVTCEFTPNNILSSSEQGETKLSWDTIERFEDTEDYIYLYMSALNAIIIPKKKVKSDIPVSDIFKELQNFLNSNKIAEPNA